MFTEFVHSVCPGTHFSHVHHGQSESDMFTTANQKATSKTVVHKNTWVEVEYTYR